MADRRRRIGWFRAGAEAFFGGATWLAGAGGPLALFAVRGAAALTWLVIDRADARWEAVLDQPLGSLGEGYNVPGPRAVLRRFSRTPDWPGVERAFADEVRAGDWEALQAAHKILHEVVDLDRPVLRRLFADELARGDWRAIVQGYPQAKEALDRMRADPRIRASLAGLWSLITGAGPEADDAAARARLEAHWDELKALALEPFS